MNYLKYFQNMKYELNNNDCWTFLQDVFEDEEGVRLPNHPIMTDKADIATYLTSNIPYRIVKSAHKGCVVYYNNGETHHVGYAIDNKKFIHKTIKGVEISIIPEKAIIYEYIK